jgi:hypothetical protein
MIKIKKLKNSDGNIRKVNYEVAFDEVVFKFRRTCVCSGIYNRMYENLPYAVGK